MDRRISIWPIEWDGDMVTATISIPGIGQELQFTQALIADTSALKTALVASFTDQATRLIKDAIEAEIELIQERLRS